MLLDNTFFKRIDSVQFLESFRPGRNKGGSKITDIRDLKYNPSKEIYFKIRFSNEW